jgi:hypothetical protein
LGVGETNTDSGTEQREENPKNKNKNWRVFFFCPGHHLSL